MAPGPFWVPPHTRVVKKMESVDSREGFQDVWGLGHLVSRSQGQRQAASWGTRSPIVTTRRNTKTETARVQTGQVSAQHLLSPTWLSLFYQIPRAQGLQTHLFCARPLWLTQTWRLTNTGQVTRSLSPIFPNSKDHPGSMLYGLLAALSSLSPRWNPWRRQSLLPYATFTREL